MRSGCVVATSLPHMLPPPASPSIKTDIYKVIKIKSNQVQCFFLPVLSLLLFILFLPNTLFYFLVLFKTKTFSSRVHSAVNCAPLICHHRLLFMIYFFTLFTHLLLIIDHLLFVYCFIYFSSTALNSKHKP